MASLDAPRARTVARARSPSDAPGVRPARALDAEGAAWRPLVRALMLDAEEQRGRVAAHVHGDIEPLLISIKLSVDDAIHRLGDGAPEGAAQLLAAVPQRLRELVEDLRTMADTLRPRMLHERGLLAALAWQSDAFASLYPDIGVVRRLTALESEVPRALQLDIYRITEQALNNVARHSGASWVRIGLFRERALLHLLIEDNGVGFAPAVGAARPGAGLVLVRQRVDAHGGRLLLRSMLRQGTQLRAVWPLSRQAPQDV